VGLSAEETWAALLRGESGVKPVTLFDCADHATKIAGEGVGFRPEMFIDRKDIKKKGRFIQFGVAARKWRLPMHGSIWRPKFRKGWGFMLEAELARSK
jgi:3-oxoacyl-[acyl-carrier-protein] synthase II